MTKECTVFDEEHPGFGEMIGRLAEEATAEAFDRVMQTVGRVMVIRDGKLIYLYADGTEEFIKEVEPWIKIEPGTKFKIK